MEDFVLSIVAKMVEYAVDPILHHAGYLCCFNNFARNLRKAKEELELTQDNMKKQVREATKRNEKIEPMVEKWLKDAEKVLEEVQLLEGRISEVSKCYFSRRCQYFLAKEIARKTEKMTQLNGNIKFEPFSRLTELQGMKYYSSKNFVLFKSIESTYNKLLEALKDKSVCMIGLCGIGGSGKTTLTKEVGKKAEDLQLFEKVVMVTVSQTPNIRSIQEQIADQLDFKLREDSNIGKARRLSERLRKGTTLVILDGVWGKLDFEAIGIPLNENNKGCEVLLTTRSRQVCTSMQCQSIIELNLLTGEEPWALFKLHANITDDSLDALKVVARNIVNECKGLPIAIVTVGSTLRGKTFEEWESALSRLEDSIPLDIPNGLTSPHVCLKLSYDNLTNQFAKSLLLLCSIFPENHEIDLEDLFRFRRGLEPFGTFGTMEKVRREMHVAVNILRDSCLLMHTSNKEKVKMHDIVRDVALWIASERGQPILASTATDPRMLVEDETIQDKKAISLWDLKNGQLLDDQLNCPTLQILLLHSSKVNFEVSNVYFERMKMLKILAFLTSSYKLKLSRFERRYTLSLPQSIESLKNLHTLCLRGYELGDISILERLQSLEILDLRGSCFDELPNGIVALKKLKLLDLYKCQIVNNNAYKVIGGCLQLQELYLHLYPHVKEFPHNVSFSRLRRYVIIQHHAESYPLHQQTDILEEHRLGRALCIDGFNASAQSFISLPIKDLFLRAEYLHLERLRGGYENVIPSFRDPEGMNQLIVLILKFCPEIECIFDNTIITNTNVFSCLVTLGLYDMDSLKEVFPRNSKLCCLKVLRIERCPMLTSLFMPSIVQTLEVLENLEISYCSELMHIIKEVEEGYVDYVSSQGHTSLMLPKLRRLVIYGCDRLEYILPMYFARRLVSLEELGIRDCNELKHVFGSEKEHHLSVYQHQSHHQTNIDINLYTLWLGSLPNLVGIWFDYCHTCLPNLKRLDCTECPRLSNFPMHKAMIDSDLQQDTTGMENEILWLVATTFNHLGDQMFSSELKVVLKSRYLDLSHLGVKGLFQFQMVELGINGVQVPLNLDLSILDLTNLPELKFIWKGPTNFLSLQMLEIIRVYGCPKLKTIFSPAIVRSLPMLRELDILNCEELEQIFDSSDAQELKSLYTCSQQVCFPKLYEVKVQECNKLKCLFYNFVVGHFPCLTFLTIQGCSKLEKVFAFECEYDDYGQEGTSKDGEQVLLENLKYILKSLPNFTEIHYKYKLKDHATQFIKEGPKYSPGKILYPFSRHNSYASDYNVK
ncbi:disease resistance protein At4g27190-like [Glycine soja]|uniref:Disease resistance protein n=2 Tax=Glycine soja TaxID=3848 RepID=A0A445H8T0_GLYSO|nr:disease resistance protein At4g27190-like [Glycine soja]RZB69997.1 Disease resistance protein [Glycine soja]